MEVEIEKVSRAISMESTTTFSYFCAMLAMEEVPLVEVMMQALSKLRFAADGLAKAVELLQKEQYILYLDYGATVIDIC